MLPVNVRQQVNEAKRIEGWFSADAAMLFAWIDEIQKANEIVGDAFEIGCHHGKSARLLGAIARPDAEKLGVCDLFGEQGDNVSRSGQGDLEIFTDNLQSVRDSGVTLKVFQKNSAELSAAEIGRTYRFFHIDGGHNPDEALVDLRLAAECTIDGGIIAVDDPFRMEWPGVTEAVLRFLDEHDEFKAILVGCNKLLLARSSWCDLYLSKLECLQSRNSYGFGYPWKLKKLPFHRFDMRILYVPDYRQKKSLGNLARYVYHKVKAISLARNGQSVAETPAAVDADQ